MLSLRLPLDAVCTNVLKQFLFKTPFTFNYHLRSGVLVVSACLYVCQTITFESLDVGSSFSRTRAVYLHRIRIKFVYEGHLVKVKVIGAKNVENSYFRNAKLRSAIITVLLNIEP